MGININHDQWLEIKAKREKAFNTHPPTDDEREGELSVLAFLTDDYLKDAGDFNDDIDTDNGFKISFKEFKDDRTLFSIVVSSVELPMRDLKEKFYGKVVEYAKSDLPWNVSDFNLLHGGKTMDEELDLWHYVTSQELDNGEMSLVVVLKLKGGGKTTVMKEGKKEKMEKKAREYFQKLNDMSKSICADVSQITEVQRVQAKLNDFIQKVHSSGGQPALIGLLQTFYKQDPLGYDEALDYLKGSKTNSVEVKLRNVALKMMSAEKLEDMTDAIETMNESVKTAVVMGYNHAVASSSRFGLTELVNLMVLLKTMSSTNAVPSDAHMG
eukprot:Skav210907  [mRNA]  locus=scaffold4581:31248:32225:+ [translate_table: standard]